MNTPNLDSTVTSQGVNVDLLETAIEHIETNPDTWGQNNYRTCLAATIATVVSDGEWEDLDDLGCEALIAFDADHPDTVYRGSNGVLYVHVADRAARLLGLPRSIADELLFHGFLTLDDLRDASEAIKAGSLYEDPSRGR